MLNLFCSGVTNVRFILQVIDVCSFDFAQYLCMPNLVYSGNFISNVSRIIFLSSC